MTADKLADAILNKCDIYYGGALISKRSHNREISCILCEITGIEGTHDKFCIAHRVCLL